MVSMLATSLASAESFHFDTMEINVGTIDLTRVDTLLCTFQFRNLSDSAAWFTRGKVSCECSEMIYPQDTINPQQKGLVSTTIATEELQGDFARFFMLYDQSGQEYMLIVSGVVIVAHHGYRS